MISQNNLVNRWFIKVTSILIILCILYLILHISVKGKVENHLNSTDITNINLLLNNNLSLINDTSTLENKQSKDTLENIKLVVENSITPGELIEDKNMIKADSLKKLVLIYVFSKFPPVSRLDSIYTANSLMKFDKTTLSVIICQYSFRTKSFFWLTEGWIYLEIIFWSLFGLICSLLFNVSEAVSIENFKDTEKPIHLAKLLYTPFIVLIIYLAADMLSTDNSITIPRYGTGIIVFSFILGFFSRRTIDLLDKLKDLILPGGKKEPDIQVHEANNTDNQNELAQENK